MFCLHCGTALPDGARFCSQCATPVGEVTASDDKPMLRPDMHKAVLVVKPRMVTWVILARYIPLQINLTIMGAFVFGILADGYHLWMSTLIHPLLPFVFMGVFFFVITPIVIYFGYHKTMDATRYEFFHNRLEYYEGFWTVQHKILYYKQVTEISLRRNIIQRWYGIGTIHFSVPGMRPKHTGLFLPDIEDPVSIYEKIKQLVGAY